MIERLRSREEADAHMMIPDGTRPAASGGRSVLSGRRDADYGIETFFFKVGPGWLLDDGSRVSIQVAELLRCRT